jgi:hypothetical protein
MAITAIIKIEIDNFFDVILLNIGANLNGGIMMIFSDSSKHLQVNWI